MAIKPHLVIAPDSSHSPESPSYRWHLTTTEGKVLAQDPNSYATPELAETAVRNLVKWVAQAFQSTGIERRTTVLARVEPEVTIADVSAEETQVVPSFDPEYDEPEVDFRDPSVVNDVLPAEEFPTDADGNQPGPPIAG